MKNLHEYLNHQLENPEFAEEFEEIRPELDIIRALVDARNSQKLTQKELSKRTGINQSDISKIENGTRNPTIRLLQRLAAGMDMTLRIEFVPKKTAK